MTGHKPYHWKGGRYTHKGYIYVLAKDHPAADEYGYVLEHRLVYEKSVGRLLKPGEIVHHKNGNRSDNRLKNLAFLPSQSFHIRRHYPKGTQIGKGMHYS